MAARFWVAQPISAIADNGSGNCRCTVSSTTGMTTGDTRTFFGVTGTTGLNGARTITVIDATHLDVSAVAFVATGTGSIYGAWDSSNTNNWVSTSGGTNYGQTVPGTADTATFDANSGGGTVTPSSTAISLTSLTFGAFTNGTLDFSVNNPNVTISTLFSGTSAGTVTRALKMGGGVWTFGGGTSAQWNFVTTSGLSFTVGSSSIVWLPANTASSFFGGGLTWGALTINANASTPSSMYQIEPGNSVNNTFASLTVNAPAVVRIRSGATQTFSGGITVNGSSFSNMVTFLTDGVSNAAGTMAVGATSNVAYTAWYGITGATNAINATNSVSIGNVSSGTGTLSITAPSGSGVVGVIGS